LAKYEKLRFQVKADSMAELVANWLADLKKDLEA
jgi:hypothetical protein